MAIKQYLIGVAAIASLASGVSYAAEQGRGTLEKMPTFERSDSLEIPPGANDYYEKSYKNPNNFQITDYIELYVNCKIKDNPFVLIDKTQQETKVYFDLDRDGYIDPDGEKGIEEVVKRKPNDDAQKSLELKSCPKTT